MRLLKETYYIYLRNQRVWLLQPANVLPTLFINVFLFVVFGASFGQVVQIPGFPAENYIGFLIPVIIIQAMVFSGGDAGFGMLTDMLSGYFDKLLLAPIHRLSILIGILLVAGTRGLLQALVIVGIALVWGVSFATGPLGIIALIFLGVLFGVAWSCLGLIIALKTKSVQATQSSFVVFFPAIFLTTGFMPKELLAKWFQVAVTVNPVNYVLESLRVIVVQGWEWDTFLPGVVILMAMTVGLIAITTWLYRRATA